MNRPTLRAVLVLACAMLCAGLLAGCGDADDPIGSPSAHATLQQTVDATSALDSARVRASFKLEPDGMLALGGPTALSASGPFAAGDGDEFARFDFALAGALARRDVRARAISTGKRIFVRINGTDYVIGKDARSKHRTRGAKRAHGLASLGLDPSGWVSGAQEQGSATLDGVETIHIVGELDVKAVLDDVAKLIGRYAVLLTPQLRQAIERAVKSSKVDVWTGAQDKILRRLAAKIDFKFDDGQSPIPGLDGGRIALRVDLADINATTVNPTAPTGAKPLSDLLDDDGLDALFTAMGGGLFGEAGGGGDGEAFRECTPAGADPADIQACLSRLAGKHSP